MKIPWLIYEFPNKAVEKLNSDNEERNIEINSQLLKLSIENERSLRDANTTK